MELTFSSDSPPLAAIAAAKIAGVSLTSNSTIARGCRPPIALSNRQRQLLKYVGRTASIPDFYGRDAYESCQIDEWLDFAPIFGSGSEFEGACSSVDEYLLEHTFLVGNSILIADLAIWAGLAGTGLRWESLRKSKKYQNLIRWFNSISSEYDGVLSEFLATYIGKRGSGKSIPSNSQTSCSRSIAKENGVHVNETAGSRSAFELDLPDAEVGKVKLRFAPEPSGYLHIGQSKAALSNQYFAELYKGQLIVRFDDTHLTKKVVSLWTIFLKILKL